MGRFAKRSLLLAAAGLTVFAAQAAARPLDRAEDPYSVPIKFQIEDKAWIPFAHVVDPLRLLTIPYLSNLEGNCFTPSSTLDKVRTTVSSFYRGDDHVPYAGSYRVSSVVKFDWNGSSISSFGASGSYGTTHRDLIYHTPSGDTPCLIAAATATSATSGTGSGSSLQIGYASKNPLVTPAAATPAIDSDVTGSVAPDGTLTLHYSDDLFPSHGIQVIRDGTTAVTDTIGDASCLGTSNVVGAAGAAILAWGLTHQSNSGTLVVKPTDSGVVLSTPSPLCTRSLWATIVSSGGKAADASAAAVNQIMVAPVVGGVVGTPLPLENAAASGLVSVTDTDSGTVIASDASKPVRISASGSDVAITTQKIVNGQAQPPAVYGPFNGSVSLDTTTTGAQATVVSGGKPSSPHAPARKPPVTRASVTVRGKSATVRFTVSDRFGVAYTRAFVGKHSLRVVHHQVKVPRKKLAKLSFYSVDTFGNVERAHGLTKGQLRRAGVKK